MNIWCLFSIENNYDQPKNNLICFWSKEPTGKEIRVAVEKVSKTKITTKQANQINKCKNQLFPVRMNDADYRVQVCHESEVIAQ